MEKVNKTLQRRLPPPLPGIYCIWELCTNSYLNIFDRGVCVPAAQQPNSQNTRVLTTDDGRKIKIKRKKKKVVLVGSDYTSANRLTDRSFISHWLELGVGSEGSPSSPAVSVQSRW